MRFADPHACPSCGGTIAGQDRCPHCDLVLNSYTSLKLWQTLLEADALLERAKAESTDARPAVAAPFPAPSNPSQGAPTTASTARPTPASAGPPFDNLGPMPAPSPTPKTGRTWSTGSIILGLGALCLLVAAFVFITVSWSLLGATGRTIVLLIITIAVAAGAVYVTRSRLRASAEALWSVFFGLFTIDFFAARGYGLLGLDGLSDSGSALLYGLIMAIGGVSLAVGTRATLPLVVPSLAAGIGVWTAGPALSATIDGNAFWRTFAGLVLTAIAAAVVWKLGLRITASMAAAALAFFYFVAGASAIDELVSSPSLSQVAGEGHGVPVLVMIALTITVGLAFKPGIVVAATLASWGAALLVMVPAVDASTESGFITAALLAAIPAAALLRGTNDWIRGARVAVAALVLLLGVAALGWVVHAAEAVTTSAEETFGNSWSPRLLNAESLPGPGWLAFVAFAGTAVAVFAILRWPEAKPFASSLLPLPLEIAGTGLAVGVIAYEPPVIVVAYLVLALGVGLLLLTRTAGLRSAAESAWTGVALVLVVIPAVVTLASEPVTLVVWLSIAAVLAAVARIAQRGWARLVSCALATGLLLGSVAVAADLAGAEDVWISFSAIVAALLVIITASFPLRGFLGREVIEVTASVGVIAGLGSIVERSLGSQAFVWTVVGGVFVILGLFVRDRRFFRYVGVAALGVAWVMRLAASNVETVEAYTAPFAVVLLGAGFLAMRENPQLRTAVALTPGLTLAFLPSLPQALDEPTGLRALLLGLTGLLALGVGTWRKWQMPFVFGASIVTLLVLWNVGPLANGLPRWTLIAAAGVVLITSGITWESRVRNARSAAEFVQNLR